MPRSNMITLKSYKNNWFKMELLMKNLKSIFIVIQYEEK